MIWFLTTPKQCNQPSQIIPISIDQVDLTVERGGNEEKTAVKDERIGVQAGEEVDRGKEKLKLGRSLRERFKIFSTLASSFRLTSVEDVKAWYTWAKSELAASDSNLQKTRGSKRVIKCGLKLLKSAMTARLVYRWRNATRALVRIWTKLKKLFLKLRKLKTFKLSRASIPRTRKMVSDHWLAFFLMFQSLKIDSKDKSIPTRFGSSHDSKVVAS